MAVLKSTDRHMGNKPIISIVLPTYNRLRSLRSIFLPSLNSQMYREYELVLVDDCSTDGTVSYFQSQTFFQNFPHIKSHVRYIRNDLNIGTPLSRNKGVQKSHGNWIFMVEDDLILEGNNFLDHASKYLEQYGNTFSIVSPMLIGHSPAHYDMCFNSFIKVGKLSGEIYMNPQYKNIQKDILSTHACSFIKKSVFRTITYPNIRGLAFREESDFYFRALKDKHRILYLGDKLITQHHNDLSKTGGTRQNKMNAIRIQIEYLKFHYWYLERNYTFPQVRIIAFVLVWISRQFAVITKNSYLKCLIGKIAA